jgi:hypothetical protein
VADSPEFTSKLPLDLDRDMVIRLQTQLVHGLGARIGIDGIIGPLTIAAARDALTRGASLLDPATMALAGTVSSMKATGQAYTWAMRSDGEVASNPETGEIAKDLYLFWKRGVPVGTESRVVLGTCDTVLLVSSDFLVAIGVLLAGNSLTFLGADGYLRHPVRI